MHYKSFLDVGSVKTHVACWGRWVEESHPDEVIICIPGNPGVAGFYYPYLEDLHRITRIPVWIVGHAGHEEPTTSSNMQLAMIGSIRGREHLFNLNGQVLHKLDFIKKYTKATTRVHLLGHSVGAWIAMELLKNDSITTRITSANMLFPTIQHIADSPNGFWLNTVLRKIPMFILALVWFFNKCPRWLRHVIVKMHFYFTNAVPMPIYIESAIKYLSPSVAEKVLFMAFDEMDSIRDLDHNTLLRNKNRVKILYGNKDGWAPSKLFTDIQRLIPELYVRRVHFQHAFMLNAHEQMAEMTADLIPK